MRLDDANVPLPCDGGLWDHPMPETVNRNTQKAGMHTGPTPHIVRG